MPWSQPFFVPVRSEVLAQRVEQAHARFELERARGAVDGEVETHGDRRQRSHPGGGDTSGARDRVVGGSYRGYTARHRLPRREPRPVPHRRRRGRARRSARRGCGARDGRSGRPSTDWSQGVPLAYLQELCRLLGRGATTGGPDRAPAQRAAAVPHRIDGLGIHFLHVRSPHADALPLVLHARLAGVGRGVPRRRSARSPIRPRTAATRADAFHVVCPSLPGYGFSDRAGRTGLGRRADRRGVERA